MIVGVVSHEQNLLEISRGRIAKQAVCGGYRGKVEINGPQIILPGKAFKKDTRYQKDKKRKQCRRREAIEPIIGHLKSDYRMARNYLKGAIGDHINLLMAACAWNLKQWLLAILALFLVAETENLSDFLMEIKLPSHAFWSIKVFSSSFSRTTVV